MNDGIPSDEDTNQFDIFAGRETELTRIQQTISDPNTPQVIAFSGIPQVGKTTLLQRIKSEATDNYICVYIPMKDLSLRHEFLWLRNLSQAIQDSLATSGFAVNLPPPPDAAAELRNWLRKLCLPKVYQMIRSHRTIILLLDDIDYMLKALYDATLPDDTFIYLSQLVHPQLAIITTFDITFETKVAEFSPLPLQDRVYRLRNLVEENIRLVLNTIYPHNENMTPIVTMIYHLTGGTPVLLHSLIQKVIISNNTLSINIIQKEAISVYTESKNYFRIIWDLLSQDEKQVLTAIANLLYESQNYVIDLNHIEKWLVETDYLTNLTEINAALRGLEYLDIIEGGHTEVTIRAGLMQKWLLEYANPEKTIMHSTQAQQPNTLLLVGIIGVLLIGLLLLLASSTTTNYPIPPTITLNTGE